jgi:Acetyltransferase (GNAT) domain
MQSVSVRAYHDLYATLESPQLYTAPWWLEATCGPDGWDAIIRYDQNNHPEAALPYHHTRIRGMAAVTTPPFTQWVSLLEAGHATGLSGLSFLPELPRTSILDLSIRPDAALPYQDSAFPVALRYSFVIPAEDAINPSRSGYSEGLRRNIRQAEKNYAIESSGDIAGFLLLCRQSYQQQKMNTPAWLDRVVPAVYIGLQAQQCGQLTVATSQGKIIAGILTGWDSKTSYYLAGGRTADEKGASAHALLLDHAVLEARKRRTAFDFEGSMHPGIATFFQSFGAIPFPYWHIRKYRGLGRLWSALRK